jgi:hypothetical protein
MHTNTIPSTRPAPRVRTAGRNEDHARIKIDAALQRHRPGAPIDRTTARLIAAAIHTGHQSALARFAASGHLDREAARNELFDAPLDTPATWWRALDIYLQHQEVDHGTA